MRANLLGGPVVYLERDEIKHYLRAVFNGFASAFYPEVRAYATNTRCPAGLSCR